MKLCQFWKNNAPALGLWTEQGVVDAGAEALRRGLTAPATVLEAIRGGAETLALLKTLAEDAQCFTAAPAAPAVTGMERILCIGLNYGRHAAECKLPIPPAPVPFCKFQNALSAHGDSVRLPGELGYVEFDYEAELVAVIGKPARNISETEALDYVFGYACGNDLSCRDLQFARSGQWMLSKTFDGFAPLGPYVATAEEIDPRDLAISSRVNGELRQNSSTSDLIFSVAQIVADLSRHFTLQPGDLIYTGTPEGVAHGYPQGQQPWLVPGDQVDISIQGLGTLSTKFI